MHKIAAFLADGFEEVEALAVVDLCRRAGIEVDLVSIMGRQKVIGARHIGVEADILMEDLDFQAYDMLFLPGGQPGTTNLEACDLLKKQITLFYQKGKQLAAICAAPTIFAHMGLLKGKEACCYPSLEGELTAGGAVVTKKTVTRSGQIFTSRGLGTAVDLGLALVEALQGADVAKQLAASVVYRQNG